jgi:hypothetical protein
VFFKAIDWTKLLAKKLRSPWIPPIRDPLDRQHFEFESDSDQDSDEFEEPYVDDGTGWDNKWV